MDLYRQRRGDIEARLKEFRRFWESGSDYELFRELVFCLLTPQSGAVRCWQALCRLEERDLLLHGDFEGLRGELRTVRFMNNKAQNIIMARELFIRGDRSIREILSSEGDDGARREWLRRSVRGLGMKESSHYLRNIGLGGRQAILDRHILRRLHACGVIPGLPDAMSPARYREIEARFLSFADSLDIDPLHLDLLFWLDAAGEIFK
jgi:N-glycosylase/DNA lyase